MKRIEELDRIVKTTDSPRKHNVNVTFYWAYDRSIELEHETLDFPDTIWAYEIPELASLCIKYDIDTFTISSQMCSIASVIADFQEAGFKLDGITQIKSGYDKFDGEPKLVPAFVMTRTAQENTLLRKLKKLKAVVEHNAKLSHLAWQIEAAIEDVKSGKTLENDGLLNHWVDYVFNTAKRMEEEA